MVSRPPCLTSPFLFRAGQHTSRPAFPGEGWLSQSRARGQTASRRTCSTCIRPVGPPLLFPGHPSQFRTSITERQRRQPRCPAIGTHLQEEPRFVPRPGKSRAPALPQMRDEKKSSQPQRGRASVTAPLGLPRGREDYHASRSGPESCPSPWGSRGSAKIIAPHVWRGAKREVG